MSPYEVLHSFGLRAPMFSPQVWERLKMVANVMVRLDEDNSRLKKECEEAMADRQLVLEHVDLLKKGKHV